MTSKVSTATGTDCSSSLATAGLLCCCDVLQCIQRLKAERKQLLDQVEALEQDLEQCRACNAQLTTELTSLRCVRDQLQCKTAECEKLAACNVRSSAC